MGDILRQIQSQVWGPVLAALLVLAGVNFTILLRGVPLRKLGRALWLALVTRDEAHGEGDISHYRALTTALSASVGTGNIVGVGAALAAGGPGALLWMWVAGLVAMSTRYAEAVLAVRFRETDQRGEKSGGPMYYLEHGLGGGKLGRGLAVAFAVLGVAAALGIGSGVPAHAVADAVNGAFGTPRWLVAIVTAAAAGAVILGGIRSIGRVTGVFVPVMLLGYAAGVGALLWVQRERLPEALRLVVDTAFGVRAAAGGALGATILETVRAGASRAVFSSEAGLGTGAIAAAAARTREPVRQALVATTGTFIGTLLVPTLTGLAVLVTGVWTAGGEGVGVATAAFEAGLPGRGGSLVVAGGLALFAFSSILGWAYYGERSLVYLAGDRVVRGYRLGLMTLVGVSGLVEMDLVWRVSDVLHGLMALPNLLGLALLAGIVRRETRSWLGRGEARVEDQPRKRG